MDGLGKTTIARQIFAKHFPHFDSACFLESISQESTKLGLPYLCDKLLSDLLKDQISSSDFEGLGGKNVFIVLDDVGNAMQLDYLCGELNNLGPNSRIIVTTRNMDTLNGRVDEIHEVKRWMLKESLELFSLAAFKQSRAKEGYERLSERVVECAQGVPLALKVLGSHFYSRSPELWEFELNYLENKGESLCEIQDVLRVSYNGLEVREKEMFLDIAFFFKDENKDFVIRILDACGFNATSGIDLLKYKALITISNDNKIQMHDLHQKMAFDIVQYKKDQTKRDPRKCSRLRDTEEVCSLLKRNKGPHNKVEGIIFDLSQKVDLHVQEDTFNLMAKLRYLRLYVPLGKKICTNLYLPDQDILPFSYKLRYLEWYGYPLKSLPQPFCVEFLVEIRLPHSRVEHLWHGIQELVNLEGIDLSECKQLTNLPDLSRATKLKWCKKLESLISEKHLTSLQNIDVSGCSSLIEFSLSSDSIEGLDLSQTMVKTLHPSIGHMSNLLCLNLQGLRLQNVPKELSHLRSLAELWISNCSVVTKSKLEGIFENGLESLKTLFLKDCCNLFELPANIDSLSSLHELRLDGSNVKRLPTNIKNLSNLSIISLNNYKNFTFLPELPQHIKELRAENCTSLVKSVALYNVFVDKRCSEIHSYNYDSVVVCYPGSKVPSQLKYRTTDSKITIGFSDINDSLGFIFSVVVSPLNRMKNEHGSGAKIQCKCYREDGSMVGFSSEWHSEPITNLDMDHVFVWYDPYRFGIIQYIKEGNFSFVFNVTSDSGEHDYFDLSVKECGICPIYTSEFFRLLDMLNLDKDVESCMRRNIRCDKV
ncbi:disease resistance protein DSC1 [Trifolium repens]|nr:disease resistance protein DSC1 [Trifolium repens]